MTKRKYPKMLPGGVEFTPKLKYKRDNHFLEFLKEYQKLNLAKKLSE